MSLDFFSLKFEAKTKIQKFANSSLFSIVGQYAFTNSQGYANSKGKALIVGNIPHQTNLWN